MFSKKAVATLLILLCDIFREISLKKQWLFCLSCYVIFFWKIPLKLKQNSGYFAILLYEIF